MMGQFGRRVAFALVCLGVAAPLAARAQDVTPAQVEDPALHGPQYDESARDEQQNGDQQIEYVLPSATAWQFGEPHVSVGEPIVITSAPVAAGLDGAMPEQPLSPEDTAIIDKALALDAAELAANAPAKSLHMPGYANGHAGKLDVSRTDQPDGSGNVTVKKPLAIDWDADVTANVGADLGLAPTPKPIYGSADPLGVPNGTAGAGAAWASLNVPRIATVDTTVNARVDPTNDQGRVGTTFERAVPVGGKFAVKLRSSYSVTETLLQSQVAPADVPASRVWGHENVAKLDILPTGTTLGAGVSSTSIDPVTHNTLSAEQKIYGPLNVTTAVTDVGQDTENRSVRAAFKFNW